MGDFRRTRCGQGTNCRLAVMNGGNK